MKQRKMLAGFIITALFVSLALVISLRQPTNVTHTADKKIDKETEIRTSTSSKPPINYSNNGSSTYPSLDEGDKLKKLKPEEQELIKNAQSFRLHTFSDGHVELIEVDGKKLKPDPSADKAYVDGYKDKPDPYADKEYWQNNNADNSATLGGDVQ